jgi:isochorismate pyruvate lyase
LAPDSRKNPEDCSNMDEVRVEIDRVDRELVEKLAERWGYVERAWQVKSDVSDSRVRWRNEEVIEKVRAGAEVHGVPPELTEALWRLIISWGIQYQQSKLDKQAGD